MDAILREAWSGYQPKRGPEIILSSEQGESDGNGVSAHLFRFSDILTRCTSGFSFVCLEQSIIEISNAESFPEVPVYAEPELMKSQKAQKKELEQNHSKPPPKPCPVNLQVREILIIPAGKNVRNLLQILDLI